MAASMSLIVRTVCRRMPSILQAFGHSQRLHVRTRPTLCAAPRPAHAYCQAAALQEEGATQAAGTRSRYTERPWEYLDSEEYIDKYGKEPVWAGYRRNHKGGIPPQKTRKTCIRGEKVCGNPCPICRDPNVIVHPQNVKLLQQFISSHSGTVYDPTRTGVCMKQQKKLNKAINTARDHGLLPFQVPYVDFAGVDFSNSHDAVGSTPSLASGDPWYYWYKEITPEEEEVAKVKKTYMAYLK